MLCLTEYTMKLVINLQLFMIIPFILPLYFQYIFNIGDDGIL
jgi:hypothetical protein